MPFLLAWLSLLLLVPSTTKAQGTTSSTGPQPQVQPGQPSPGAVPAVPVDALSARVDAELKASKEHIEAIRDAATFSNRIFVTLGGLLTVVGILSWLRQRRQDEYFEERLKESDRQRLEVHKQAIAAATKEQERQSDVHTAALALLRTRVGSALEEERRLPQLLDLQRENIQQINQLTAAVAAGAKENVDIVQRMFAAIASILEFKVQEAKDVQNSLADMKAWREEKEEEERQELSVLKELAVNLRDSRHNYANPSDELQVRQDAYADRFDRMGDVLLYRLTRAKEPSVETCDYAELFLRRGTIAYYANDLIRARTMLRVAEHFFDRVGADAVGRNNDWARPCGFTKFYLALIEKNYGDMNAAKDLITSSWNFWGKDNEREFLTPVVRAEILASLGDIDAARTCLATMMSVVQRLRDQGQKLPAHEAVYVARGHLILGDTFCIAGDWEEAQKKYSVALEESRAATSSIGRQKRDNYYAHYALAQVLEHKERHDDARDACARAYDALMRSEDLVMKKALDTQILLNTLAYFCTRQSRPDEAQEYKARATHLIDTIRVVNGLELRLFSLVQKKHVSKSDFLKELFQA